MCAKMWKILRNLLKQQNNYSIINPVSAGLQMIDPLYPENCIRFYSFFSKTNTLTFCQMAITW